MDGSAWVRREWKEMYVSGGTGERERVWGGYKSGTRQKRNQEDANISGVGWNQTRNRSSKRETTEFIHAREVVELTCPEGVFDGGGVPVLLIFLAMNEAVVERCQIDIRADDTTNLQAIAMPLFDCNLPGKEKRRGTGNKFGVPGLRLREG